MGEQLVPFSCNIPATDLEELHRRLRATRWPERETVEDWSQGVPLSYLQELCDYWSGQYDWRAVEARLNGIPQFHTEIDGLRIHFLHLRSTRQDAHPLILTHGWPGSVIEFLKVAEPLANAANGEPAFHLVIPSLPGYGFSGKPTGTGWNAEKIADAWDVLMQRLGYQRYFAQGGDWGAVVTTAIGSRHADTCMGIHLNMPIVGPDPDTMDSLTEQERDALDGMAHYDAEDSAYAKQQSTRPQTVAYALADSPVGQAAWIIEKFHSWMDCDGHPENVLTRDELLDNVTLYWLTNTAASSARLYWESFRNIQPNPVKTKVGCSVFPKEIFRASKRWAEKHYDELVYFNRLERGGHFAAFEQPGLFVQELRACFSKMSR